MLKAYKISITHYYQGCQIQIFKIRSFPKKIRSLSGDFLWNLKGYQTQF